MRLSRVVAIARRDLAQELGGRRGWVLPAVMVALLGPTSAMPPLGRGLQLDERTFTASGEVPEAVAALPEVRVLEEGGRVRFRWDGDQLVVEGPVSPQLRQALDGDRPAVEIRRLHRPLHLPGRTLLLALISASTLTGAVSASIAGERSRRSLVALLSAAVTRAEIVVGKWAAWSGLGALMSLVAAVGAIALGRVEPGWWLLPMLTVPGGTVALGLFLARRAADVVGGTTVSLRVLPAALSIAGVAAWYLGRDVPWVGGLVPLGGALVAAGDTWPGPGPAVVAALSTALFTMFGLAWTARDLEESPSSTPSTSPAAVLGGAGLLAASAWLVPVLGPLLWSSAGNPVLTERLGLDRAVVAGGLGLLLASVVRAARAPEPVAELGLHEPSVARRPWALALAVGAFLALTGPVGLIVPTPPDPLPALARLRLDAALVPGWAGWLPLLLVSVADELLFRGWVQRRAGAGAAVVLWLLVKTPLDPLRGLLTGALLSGLVRACGGSVVPAVVARVVWGVLAGLAVPLGPWSALAVGALAVVALHLVGQAAQRPASAPARAPSDWGG